MQNKSEQKEKGQFVEVWEDIVSLKDLSLALVLCPFITMIAYFLAPNKGSFPLFYGLGGALIGFILCSMIVKPKRKFQQDKDEKEWI